MVSRTPAVSGEPQETLPGFTRPLGTAIIGQTGFGKTTFLETLIRQDLQDGTTALVVDPHGELTTNLLSSLPRGMLPRTLLLEINEDFPFGLNPYECEDRFSPLVVDRTVDGVVQLFKKLWGVESWPRIEYVLRNTARTIIANPGYTMTEIPALFSDPAFRGKLLRNVTNEAVLEFWTEYDTRRSWERLQLTESTINKLDQFLSSEFAALVVGQSATTIPFDHLLTEPGQLLIVSLPIGKLGEGITKFLGSVFLTILAQHIYRRPIRQRPRIHLYIDEYGQFSSGTTAGLLKEGRKFNVGTTVALQTLADLQDAANRAAVLQVGNLVCFQVTGQDAQELAYQFDITPTRTRQVVRPRTEPVYKEWQEEVWDDEEAQRAYSNKIGSCLEKRRKLWRRFNYAEQDDWISERVYYNWPVPGLSEWLATEIRTAMHQLQQDHWREMEELKQRHCTIITHRDYQGERAASELLLYQPSQHVQNRFGSYDTRPYKDEERWYDKIEELDQTHADRALEVATQLATLPPLTAMIQAVSAQGTMDEHILELTRFQRPMVVDLSVSAEVAARSRRLLGRPRRGVVQERLRRRGPVVTAVKPQEEAEVLVAAKAQPRPSLPRPSAQRRKRYPD